MTAWDTFVIYYYCIYHLFNYQEKNACSNRCIYGHASHSCVPCFPYLLPLQEAQLKKAA